MQEWLGELYEMVRDLEAAGQDDVVYGTCCVQDPRDFSPDPECSTEEERAQHKADCERYARGESISTKTRCEHVDLGEGRSAVVTPCGYGLGVNALKGNEDAREYADRLTRICGAIEMWADEAFPLEREEDSQ